MKIVSRCNLNCSYCYMYNLGDKTYRGMPKRMSQETVTALAQRVKEHALRHKIPKVAFILHGGEPLLAGREFISHFASEVRRTLEPIVQVRLSMQTNGTLLDAKW